MIFSVFFGTGGVGGVGDGRTMTSELLGFPDVTFRSAGHKHLVVCIRIFNIGGDGLHTYTLHCAVKIDCLVWICLCPPPAIRIERVCVCVCNDILVWACGYIFSSTCVQNETLVLVSRESQMSECVL